MYRSEDEATKDCADDPSENVGTKQLLFSLSFSLLIYESETNASIPFCRTLMS